MNIEKFVWTESDFERMSWHDCKIYGMSFNESFELFFDIDYIFKTEPSKGDEQYFTFWVSPATLTFRNVYDFDLSTYTMDLEMVDISRANPTIPKNMRSVDEVLEYEWTISLTSGEMSFRSVGFSQVIRERPALFNRTAIGVSGRGGISFSTEIRH